MIRKNGLNHFGRLAALVCFALWTLPQSAESQTSSSDQIQPLRHLFNVNSLDLKGRKPFHIEISFQLFDLTGKPLDTGLIEEWWASPTRYKVAIKPSSANTTASIGIDSIRESFLANQLLRTLTHPIRADLSSLGSATSETRLSNEGTQLNCIVRVPLGESQPKPAFPRNCTQVGSDALRMQTGEGDLLIVRDTPSVFHNVNTAAKISISYLGMPSITGTVETLEDLPSREGGADLPEVGLDRNMVIDASYISSVMKLTSKTPEYPKKARAAHLQGSVTLSAIITKEGTLRDLDVIATPGPLLSESATKAVQTWTYKPFFLNGTLTEVETVIYVNYNMGGKEMTARFADPVEMIRQGAPHLISSDKELALYTDSLFKLTAKAKPSRYDEEAIALLTLLIDQYESQHFPVPDAPPEEVLRFLLDQHGLTQRDLVEELGSETTVSLVLLGKRQLTREQIARLSRRFHVEPSVFFPKR